MERQTAEIQRDLNIRRRRRPVSGGAGGSTARKTAAPVSNWGRFRVSAACSPAQMTPINPVWAQKGPLRYVGGASVTPHAWNINRYGEKNPNRHLWGQRSDTHCCRFRMQQRLQTGIKLVRFHKTGIKKSKHQE